MKKIYLSLIASLVFVSSVSAQSKTFTLQELFDLDVTVFENCNDVVCQVLKARVQQAILEHINDMLREAAQQSLAQAEVIEITNEDEVVDGSVYRLASNSSGYLKELQEQPLREGQTKSYSIRNGDVNFKSTDHAVVVELWNLTRAIIPEKYRNLMERFKLINDSDNPFAGYMRQEIQSRNGDVAESWTLTVNLAELKMTTERDRRTTAEVLVHEMAHLLALNDEQVDFFVDERRCSRFYIEDLQACAEKGSYYDGFDTEFWADDFIDWTEQYADISRDSYSRAQKALTAYYNDNQGNFTSRYAASSPDEDIAEAMKDYLLFGDESDKETVWVEKIAFFNEYNDLAKLQKRLKFVLSSLF